jgi:hypothetical protein
VAAAGDIIVPTSSGGVGLFGIRLETQPNSIVELSLTGQVRTPGGTSLTIYPVVDGSGAPGAPLVVSTANPAGFETESAFSGAVSFASTGGSHIYGFLAIALNNPVTLRANAGLNLVARVRELTVTPASND